MFSLSLSLSLSLLVAFQRKRARNSREKGRATGNGQRASTGGTTYRNNMWYTNQIKNKNCGLILVLLLTQVLFFVLYHSLYRTTLNAVTIGTGESDSGIAAPIAPAVKSEKSFETSTSNNVATEQSESEKALKSATIFETESVLAEKRTEEKQFKYTLVIQKETFTSLSKQEQKRYRQDMRQHANAAKSRTAPSSLRFDWGNLPPITTLGKLFDNVQNQCQQPESRNEMIQMKLGQSGMGSSLHTWSGALCEATYRNAVLITGGGYWPWLDKEHCVDSIQTKRKKSSASSTSSSPLWCYFGRHESGGRCPEGSLDSRNFVEVSKDEILLRPCRAEWNKKYGWPALHGAAMEFLFQNVTEVVIEEAERQLKEMSVVPTEDFITIHIRWGDKWREMKLVSIEDYVDATKQILTQKERDGEQEVNIYLASEDPIAVQKFQEGAPRNWVIHQSGPKVSENRERMREVATDSDGKAGLQSLGALLISMQANRYVLATGSNWSRLINELRKNIIDPRCGNCTTIAEFVTPYVSFI